MSGQTSGPRRALRRLVRELLRDPGLAVRRRYVCPLCGWHGPFLTFNGRRHALCPACDALERHRLQSLVLRRVLPAEPVGLIVHVAPEAAIAPLLERCARRYLSTDLAMAGVGVTADLRRLPLAAGVADVVHASHVLEHIADDRAAIAEIHRVLAPGGMAVLPVPMSGAVTVEYPAPRSEEHGHVRSPGLDYPERFAEAGFAVEMFRSQDFDWRRFQLKTFEPGGGAPCEDWVPVCRKLAGASLPLSRC